MPRQPSIHDAEILLCIKNLQLFNSDGKLKKESDLVWKTAQDLIGHERIALRNLYWKFEANRNNIREKFQEQNSYRDHAQADEDYFEFLHTRCMIDAYVG